MMSPYREPLTRHEYLHGGNSTLHSSSNGTILTVSHNSTYLYNEFKNNGSSNSNSSEVLNFVFHAQNTTFNATGQQPPLDESVQVQWEFVGRNSTDLDFMNKLLNDTFGSSLQNLTLSGNESSLRGAEATSLFPPAESSAQSETASDPTVILCALLIPLLIAFGGILIIALLIRRMRRAETMREIARQNEESSFEFQETRRHSIIYNPKHSFRLPVVLGLEPLDPSALTTSIDNSTSNGAISSHYTDSNQSLNGNIGNSNINLTRSTPTGKTVTTTGFTDRILYVLNFRKRIRQKKAERKRFNIYTVSLETREQLKQIYVY